MKFTLSSLVFLTSVSAEKSGSIFGNRLFDDLEKNPQDDDFGFEGSSSNKFNLGVYQGGRYLQQQLCKCKALLNQQGVTGTVTKSNGLSKHEYISKTKSAIKEFYETRIQTSNPEITKTLEIIYKKLNTTSKPALAVFTAHAIFNTSVFAELSERSHNYFRSRGLLAIQGKPNYELLQSYTNNEVKFIDNPSLLATLKPEVIGAQVTWWNEAMGRYATDYNKTLEILKPTEWIKRKENKSDKGSGEKLYNRTRLYDILVYHYQ